MPTFADEAAAGEGADAAKVGGLGNRFVMTVSGLALALLGTLTMFSFWPRRRLFRNGARRPAPVLTGS